MRTKLSGLAVVGLLAVSASHVGATTITPSSNIETGGGDITGTGIDDPVFGTLSYTWNMFTEEGVPGTNTISFWNQTGLPAQATYTWSMLSNSDQEATMSVLAVENGAFTVLAEGTVGDSGGPLQFALANDATISFFLSTNEEASAPGAQASGSVTFAPIPLPAGALLLLTALGGLAATRRFKKSSEAA